LGNNKIRKKKKDLEKSYISVISSKCSNLYTTNNPYSTYGRIPIKHTVQTNIIGSLLSFMENRITRQEIIETRVPGRLVAAAGNHRYMILITSARRKIIRVMLDSSV
jgi:hypothetical protein